MATTNLSKTELVSNPASPEVVVNEQEFIDDAAIAGLLTHNMASDADYTLSTTPDANGVQEWHNAVINITDSGVVLTTGRSIICPVNKKLYTFVNSTAQVLTLKTSAGTGIAVAVNETQILRCDGTNVVEVTAGGSSGLGTMATQDADAVAITGGSVTGITDLTVADGGTGGSDPGTAMDNLGGGRTITAGEGLSGGGNLSADRAIDLDIPGLTADASPDGVTDFVVTYDASGTAHKKVLINDLPTGGGATLADPKDSVRVASTSNITLSGEQTIDGVLTSADRVLVAGQTTGSENGIYISAAGAWVRAADANTDAEVTAGMNLIVTEGTSHADSLWVLDTDDPITLDTTALTFTKVALTGSGDVIGPASAVDGNLTVFDGTTGKLIKDGGAVPTGGLTQTAIAPTTGNITATIEEMAVADLSGLTANRNFVIPAGTAGDRIGITVTVGDPDFEFLIIGDTGITINGGTAATEWSRLFITGETVILVATSATNWQIEQDGRIPQYGRLEDSVSPAQTLSSSTATLLELDTVVTEIGCTLDNTTGYDITVRRDGRYSVAGQIRIDGSASSATGRFFVLIDAASEVRSLYASIVAVQAKDIDGSADIDLVAGEAVSLQGLHTDPSSQSIAGGSLVPRLTLQELI